MSRVPSPRQAVVLETIRQSIAIRGFPPTIREIAKAMGIRSTNGVSDHLLALERKGLITVGLSVARGIRIVDDPPTSPGTPPPIPWAPETEDATAERIASYLDTVGLVEIATVVRSGVCRSEKSAR